MIRLPSRYEDLSQEFRVRLKPNPYLLDLVKQAFSSISTSGGIRFLPVLGESGSGKSCATLEIGSHLPDCAVFSVPHSLVSNMAELQAFVESKQRGLNKSNLLIFVIDQYEELAAERGPIPSQFVECLSLFDRSTLREIPTLFIWLTTSLEFQKDLAKAANRNRRILVCKDFKLSGPNLEEWPDIIQDNFQFHNINKTLADYNVLIKDLIDISVESDTIGAALESVGTKAAQFSRNLTDLSNNRVMILWPTTDSHRTDLISAFSDARIGYKLDWNYWFKSLNLDERDRFPLHALNRARIYFDVRFIPIPVSTLCNLCKNLVRWTPLVRQELL